MEDSSVWKEFKKKKQRPFQHILPSEPGPATSLRTRTRTHRHRDQPGSTMQSGFMNVALSGDDHNDGDSDSQGHDTFPLLDRLLEALPEVLERFVLPALDLNERLEQPVEQRKRIVVLVVAVAVVVVVAAECQIRKAWLHRRHGAVTKSMGTRARAKRSCGRGPEYTIK